MKISSSETIKLDPKTVELLKELAGNEFSLYLQNQVAKRILRIYLNKKKDEFCTYDIADNNAPVGTCRGSYGKKGAKDETTQ